MALLQLITIRSMSKRNNQAVFTIHSAFSHSLGRERTFPEYSRNRQPAPMISTSGVFSAYRN